MGLILDTSVLIALERARHEPQLVRRLSFVNNVFALSTVTWSELVHGLHRAKTAEQFQQREDFLKAISSEFEMLPFTVEAATLAGRISAQAEMSGRSLPLADLQIGTTALSVNYGVLTANRRDFDPIPGLRVIPFHLADLL